MVLLPELSVQRPASQPGSIRLLRFAEPAPFREVGLFWRPVSVYRDLLPELAQALRHPTSLISGAGAAGVQRGVPA